MTEQSRRGRTGLQNLGNTCFMNSAIQCLSHTRFLADFFLNTEHNYEEDLNLDNPLGSKGELTKAFCKVIRHLWMGSSSSYSPYDFKASVSSFAQQFRGYEQHDSQELLSFVLDGLHEDLNRVKVKPYSEELKFESDVRERDIAAAFWQQHLDRNQSLIVDYMHGQYRSQVTCPLCRKTSLTFDPFLMLSVDIPPPLKKYEVCIVPSSLSQSPTRYAFCLESDSTISALKLEMAKSLGADLVSSLVFVQEEGYKLESVLDDASLVPESYKVNCLALSLPAIRTPTSLQVGINILKEDKTYGYVRSIGVIYPRILCFEPDATLRQVHFAIYRFIRPLLRLGNSENAMEIDEAEDQFMRELENDYVNRYEAANPSAGYGYGYARKEEFLTIKAVNYNNKWNMKKGAYDPCPYCSSTHYSNCSLPFSLTLLAAFLSNHDSLRIPQLEVILPSSLHNPSFRLETDLDPSISQIEKQLDTRFGGLNLQECLAFTCKEKTLTVDNFWYCKECKEHVSGAKKMTIYRLPRVLTIHLKRFKQGEWTTQKNEKTIEFPIQGLDMSPYMQSDLPQPVVYDLFAVNDHSGALGFGHYTAHAKDEQGWCLYNDSYLSEIRNETDIVSSSAYVLFYEAR